jgi:hypothetical protein
LNETDSHCLYRGYQVSDESCYSYINSSPTFNTPSGSSSSGLLVLKPFSVTAHYTSVQYTGVPTTQTNPAGTLTLTSSSAVGTKSAVTVVSGSVIAELRAWKIRIAWQSTDQQVISWLAQQGNGSGNSTTHPAPVPPPSKKLSAGVIAGIVIGVIAALAFSIVTVLFFCKRARKNRVVPEAETVAYETAEVGTYEYFIRDFDFLTAFALSCNPDRSPIFPYFASFKVDNLIMCSQPLDTAKAIQ